VEAGYGGFADTTLVLHGEAIGVAGYLMLEAGYGGFADTTQQAWLGAGYKVLSTLYYILNTRKIGCSSQVM
jgi:hypothetical protein